MFDPTIGRWLEEDPIDFEGGDANLYRMTGNNALNATDRNGLEPELAPAPRLAHGFDRKGDRLFLVVELAVQFRNTQADAWSPERMAVARDRVVSAIERVWNNHPFYFESSDGKKLIPGVAVRVVDDGARTTKELGWDVKLFAHSDEKLKKPISTAYVENPRKANQLLVSTMFLNETDLVVREEKRKDDRVYRRAPVAHEFGHLLGLQHPGLYLTDAKLRLDEEGYTDDWDSLMGGREGMRGYYFYMWADYLDDKGEAAGLGKGPWKMKWDEKHPLFQSTMEGYEKGVIHSPEIRRAIPFGKR